MKFKKIKILFSFAILFLQCNVLFAQEPDKIYKSYIATAQLYAYGDQTQLPIYTLGGDTKIQLDFDDLEGGYKNYYYTYQLCDYDWKPNDMLQTFDYIKGFTQNRITNYRYSSIALTKYTHYQALLPDRNSMPLKSGNYLLKIFLDGDTSKLVFTKRLLVVDPKSTVSASVIQSLGTNNFTSNQKVRFFANIGELNAFSAAQQVKAVVLQNNNWATAQRDIKPTFVRGGVLDYSSDLVANFPGGKEWRWLDLRNFSLQTDRVETANYGKTTTDIFLKPDVDRSAQRYIYYPDYNGAFNIVTYQFINPFWQSDYATVHFSFAPPNGTAFEGKDIYLDGQLTGFGKNEKYKMVFNAEKGLYETNIFLKQGYYTYAYTLADKAGTDYTNTLEGNYWDTENNYTILIYYKSFTDRVDQLIGVSQINSRRERQGLGF
jgi:Domain of unknown function (DUF5103)